jgi:hypothetical protein
MSKAAIPLKPEVIIPGRPGKPGDDALLEMIAWLMDRAFPIPGTKIRVGLDAILGLIPVGGDAITGLIQCGVVIAAITKYKVPKAVAARMIANVMVDMGIGAIPIVGDVFDVFFKANTRNLGLLREASTHQALGRPMPSAPSRRYIIGMIAGMLGFLLLLFLGAIALATWVVKTVWNAGAG